MFSWTILKIFEPSRNESYQCNLHHAYYMYCLPIQCFTLCCWGNGGQTSSITSTVVATKAECSNLITVLLTLPYNTTYTLYLLLVEVTVARYLYIYCCCKRCWMLQLDCRDPFGPMFGSALNKSVLRQEIKETENYHILRTRTTRLWTTVGLL